MKLSVAATVLTCLLFQSALCSAVPNPDEQAQSTNANANSETDLWSTLSSMKVAPPGSNGGGIIHLGDDGVLRTLDEHNPTNVLAYKQLSPDEITQMLHAFPGQARQRLTDLFRGVDGRTVTDEKDLWHPGADILPPFQDGDDDDDDFSQASVDGTRRRQPMTSAEEALSKLRRDEEQVACHNFACRTPINCRERDYRCTYCHRVDHYHVGVCFEVPNLA